MKKNMHFYYTIFSSTFLLSAFTFGGGFVIVPLMKKKFVEELNWIQEDEMLDLVAIAQSSPGAIAVNASIMIGHKLDGFKGAIIAAFGTILPPLLILSVISFFYESFIQNQIIALMMKSMVAAVGAIILNVAFKMAKDIIKLKHPASIIIMLTAFIATFFFKVNVLYIILVAGFVGALFYKKGLDNNDTY